MDQVRINLENSNTSVVLRDPLHFGTEAFGASAQRPAAMAAFMHQKKIVLVIAWYVIMCPSRLCLPPPLESQSLPLCLMRFRLVLVPVSPRVYLSVSTVISFVYIAQAACNCNHRKRDGTARSTTSGPMDTRPV